MRCDKPDDTAFFLLGLDGFIMVLVKSSGFLFHWIISTSDRTWTFCTTAAFMQGGYITWMSYFSLEVHVHTVNTSTQCTVVLGPLQSLICLKAERRRTFSP
ncbi:hypothetical protein NL108_012460 [Boleophthalmus pectinirostris]|nr:hypothetical protein NL108_012460 [Boleophthalmus pectinirostris]